MYNPRFEKARFKKDVQDNVKRLFRKELDEANPQEQFQAVSYAVKEAIIDDWIETQKKIDKEDPKIVYYMSMEFLMGRALGNNLINMTAYTEVKEALDERGYNSVNQLAGYLISNDPAYISSHNNARTIIQSVERYEIIEELVRAYLEEDK